MSESNRVPPGEAGKLRIIAPGTVAVSGAPPAVAAARLLGLPDLAAGQVERLSLADMEGLGLSGYLAEGWDVPADALAPDRGRLDALQGVAFLVLSRAFEGKGAVLSPLPGVEVFGPYAEGRGLSALPMPPAPEEPVSLSPAPPPEPPHTAVRLPLALVALVGLPVLVILFWWLK